MNIILDFRVRLKINYDPDSIACVDHISVDFSKRVIGKVTPQNTYKLKNATIVYNTSSIELTILNSPFANKTATKRIPNDPNMAYLP